MEEIHPTYKNYPEVIEFSGTYCTLLGEELRNGIKIPSPREEMEIRLKSSGKGKPNFGLNRGVWTSATFIYHAERPPLLTLLFNDVVDYYLQSYTPKEFYNLSNNVDKGYFTTGSSKCYDNFFKKATKDLEKKIANERNTLILPFYENFSIVSNPGLKVFSFLARDNNTRKDYFELNRGEDIFVVLRDKKLINSIEGTVLNQLWFSSLESNSRIRGEGNMGYIGWMRCLKKLYNDSSKKY